MAVERKYERDIDLLLAEEFMVNKAFANLFKGLTRFSDKQASVADVFVSRSNELGESDLIVIYEDLNGERFALCIEDKVDAPLQPDQEKRYRKRADRDVIEGLYIDYEVILCAPQFYIENHPGLDDFKNRISYEKIADLIRIQMDIRSEYRATYLETAGKRTLNKWIRNQDDATDAFWNAAYEVAVREFPLLEMRRLEVTKNTNWIVLRPHDFPTRPKHVSVAIKGDRGFVDLAFANTAAYLFMPEVAALLPSEMSVHQTGRSAAIRIETERFDVPEGIEIGLPKIRRTFEAGSCLISFFRQFKQELLAAAEAATLV